MVPNDKLSRPAATSKSDALQAIRHDLRTLNSLLFSLRAGLERLDGLDPDMTALCDGATERLQSIIERCRPQAPNGY